MKYNGKWFAGWGFMRFWELERAGTANHNFMTGTNGDGDIAEFPGAIKPETWIQPLRARLTGFGALPRGVVFH